MEQGILTNVMQSDRARAVVRSVAPSASDLIRMDHTKVIAAFHRYRIDTPAAQKQALANTICLLLEIHATLEEEIFYPAMREIDPEFIDVSLPEHEQIHRLISDLRAGVAGSAEFDETLMTLMRTVIHHAADEETVLLPRAERLLGQRMNALGARMTTRKIQLGLPRVPEFTVNAARAAPASRMFMGAAAIAACAFILTRAFRR
jgi:hemerythrin superfamily protein